MIDGFPYEVWNSVPLTQVIQKDHPLYKHDLKVYLINTEIEFQAFFKILMKKKRVFCDTETSGFDYFKEDRIVGSSFGWGKEHFYIPCRHLDSLTAGKQPKQLSMDYLRPYYQQFFAREDLEIVFHNAKFDLKFYFVDDIIAKAKLHDTLIMWKFYNENAPGALKAIASGWKDREMGIYNPGIVDKEANLDEKAISDFRSVEAKERRAAFTALVAEKADELGSDPIYQDLNRTQLKKHIKENILNDHKYAGSKKEDIHYGYIPIYMMTAYAGIDTYLTSEVFHHVKKNMQFTEDILSLYQNEIELSDVIMAAELHGMKADRAYLQQKSAEYNKLIIAVEFKIREMLGIDPETEFSLASVQQLADAFIENGIKLTEKTEKSKKYKLNASILKQLAKEHEVAKLVLKFRELSKLKSTYFDSMLDKLTKDSIIHATFNQNVSTGRMSSQAPNMQNCPRGPAVRSAFVVPDQDYIYLFADYSQVEVRLTAHFSGDPVLLNAYRTGQDVHTKTMCAMFGLEYDEVVDVLDKDTHDNYKYYKDLRSIGKCVDPSTLIWTDSDIRTMGSLGFSQSAGKFQQKTGVFIADGLGGRTRVNATYYDGMKMQYAVVTRGGITICSETHLFALENDVLMPVLEIMVGDKLLDSVIPKLTKTNWAYVHSNGISPGIQVDANNSYLAGASVLDQSVQRFPDWVLSSGLESMLFFLGGILDTFGSVSDTGALQFKSKQSILISHMLTILRGSGICAAVELIQTGEEFHYDLHIARTANSLLSKYLRHEDKLNKLDMDISVEDNPIFENLNEVLGTLKLGIGPLMDLNVASADHMYLSNLHRTHNTLNFGLVYGVGAPGLSEQIPRPDQYLDLTTEHWIDKCEEFIETYFRTHLGVKRFINQYSREVRRNKKIINPFGRVRHLPHAAARKLTGQDRLGWLEQRAQRQGVNFLVQGTAGDLFKTAVVRVHKVLEGSKSKIVNFVHDEIQIYLHKDDIHLVNKIKFVMEDFSFKVPIVADFEYSQTSWGVKKELKAS